MDIGCEHRYPKEIDRLPPLQERLISLEAPFVYTTESAVDNKTSSGASYRKHANSHNVVFPNSAEDLITTLLPDPLLKAIKDIRISQSGIENRA
ncbi:hypothetical protein F4779DRAFT_606521 [Xylariaceae sp. FL0662B]|nr:hypothetical protein F4779DRAFT_606521 [Xylariaceae sp. FL0662B]